MADYEIPPEALGDDDDMETEEISIDDIRKHLADTPPTSVYLDRAGSPRRAEDRHNAHLMDAATAATKLIGLSHLLPKLLPKEKHLGGQVPTRIRATRGDMANPDASLDITRVYNPTTGKPEIKADINQPRPTQTRWEKLRAPADTPSLERRKDIDPKAEESQTKTRREQRKPPNWIND
jgi:hypothetical protein